MTRTRVLALAAMLLALPAAGAKKESPRAGAGARAGGRRRRRGPWPTPWARSAPSSPSSRSRCAPQITGVVTEVGFKEGQDVRAGQLLFQIDPRPLQAALAAAEAQLASNRAEAPNAGVQADRYARLVEQDFVTKEQAEEARTRAASLAAAVQADEAAVEQARLNLAYASVKAPIAGPHRQPPGDPGNVAKANDDAAGGDQPAAPHPGELRRARRAPGRGPPPPGRGRSRGARPAVARRRRAAPEPAA